MRSSWRHYTTGDMSVRASWAVGRAFEPILMTAISTIVGLIPLALGTSGIFELRLLPTGLNRDGRTGCLHTADSAGPAHPLHALRRSRRVAEATWLASNPGAVNAPGGTISKLIARIACCVARGRRLLGYLRADRC